MRPQNLNLIAAISNRLSLARGSSWILSLLHWLVLILPAQAVELRVAIEKMPIALK